MRRQLFVDTWFFIAAIDVLDSHHGNVRRLTPLLLSAQLVTHDAVFAEVLAFFSDAGAQNRVIAAKQVRAAARRMTVVATSGDLFNRALDLYEARPDKEYSLVDCISMQLMRDRGITHVLTNDHHFRQEGFVVLSDAP